jgi:L-fuconolactonase
VWDLGVRDQPWTASLPILRRSFAMADLTESLEAHAITATIVVQTICVPQETPELLALAADNDQVAGVVGWVDLTGPGVAEQIAKLRAEPGGDALVGLRHQVQAEPDPRWLARPDVRRGLAAVAAEGLCFDLLVTPAQLPAAIDAARAVSQLRFVLDHGGKPPITSARLEPWRTLIRQLAALPNVAVKLSGLVTEAPAGRWSVAGLRPYTDVLLGSFGPNRTMFGSDWPVCLLAASYDDVISAAEALTFGLANEDYAEVFGGTAARWYGLPR